jgi:hypothetical protein
MGLDLMPLGSLKKLMLFYQILQGEIDTSSKQRLDGMDGFIQVTERKITLFPEK